VGTPIVVQPSASQVSRGSAHGCGGGGGATCGQEGGGEAANAWVWGSQGRMH
jgi:hypothetical protein